MDTQIEAETATLEPTLSSSLTKLFLILLFASVPALLLAQLVFAGHSCDEMAGLICIPVFSFTALLASLVPAAWFIRFYPRLASEGKTVGALVFGSLYFGLALMKVPEMFSIVGISDIGGLLGNTTLLVGAPLGVSMYALFLLLRDKLYVGAFLFACVAVGGCFLLYPKLIQSKNLVNAGNMQLIANGMDSATYYFYLNNGRLPKNLTEAGVPVDKQRNGMTYENTDPYTWKFCYEAENGRPDCTSGAIADTLQYQIPADLDTISPCEPVASGDIHFEGRLYSTGSTTPFFSVIGPTGEQDIDLSVTNAYFNDCRKVSLPTTRTQSSFEAAFTTSANAWLDKAGGAYFVGEGTLLNANDNYGMSSIKSRELIQAKWIRWVNPTSDILPTQLPMWQPQAQSVNHGPTTHSVGIWRGLTYSETLSAPIARIVVDGVEETFRASEETTYTSLSGYNIFPGQISAGDQIGFDSIVDANGIHLVSVQVQKK